MKKRYYTIIVIALVLLNFASGFCQIEKTQSDSSKSSRFIFPTYKPPENASKMMWNFAGGFGLPYGVIGGKVSVGTDHFTGDAGLGILPIAWSPSFSIGGTIYFKNRYDNIRPKLTAVYSNTAAAIIMYDSGSLDLLYDETFPGIGAYCGVDWRISKTSPFCIDMNICFTFPFEGIDEVKRKYNEVKDDLEQQGYVMTDEKISLNTPKLSIGITYAPGRSLKLKYK